MLVSLKKPHPNHVFLNDFRTDTQAEINLVCDIAKECGASDAVPCHHWAQGGRGSVELAQAVNQAASRPSNFQFLYDTEVSSHTWYAKSALLYFKRKLCNNPVWFLVAFRS